MQLRTALALSAFAALTAGTANANLIITEWMANPAELSDGDGEYFEVYNSGPGAITVADLTIHDDGTDSVDLAGAAGTIGAGEFFVFGASALGYVDLNWDDFGSFFLGNSGDEIVVSLTAGGELARVDYTNGDPAGSGTAVELDNIANPTVEGNFVASTTPLGTDFGSPGAAGNTVIPEPGSLALLGLGGLAMLRRRR
ncbi:MAG: lamin tail domain-containing protein [Planctomycetota bacterium]